MFGVLALAWRDVTLLVVATLFGVRTVVFGVLLLWRLVRRPPAPAAAPPTAAAPLTAASRLRMVRDDLARWVAAALVVVVSAGTWWLSDRLQQGVAVVDAFYDAPAEMPDEPGRLLRVGDYTGQAPASATVRRILYTTTDANGGAALASALVIAPDAVGAEPRPVIAWNHGTVGIARRCAPSLTDVAATAQAIPGVDEAVAAGWVVVATDYSGQGTEGTFPYLIGEGQARSVLDGLRAVREVRDLDLADEAVIWGHSQGGHATLWTSAIAPSYAPDVSIAGTVAISPAADPRGLAERLIRGGGSGVLSAAVAWVLIPYSETYDDVVFEHHVRLPGRPLVREMSRRCTTEPSLLVSVLDGLGVSNDRPLYTGDLTGGVLGARLDQNRTVGPFTQPLLVVWGGDDEVIAADLQHGYVADLCEAGVEVEWIEYDGYDHLRIVQPDAAFIPKLLDWTAARFAGAETTPTDC